MASAERVEAESVACLMACGYAWKRGGGSHVGDVRIGGWGEDFEVFGLDLSVLIALGDCLDGVFLGPLDSFTDLDLKFIRDILAVAFGVNGPVSEVIVGARFMDRLLGILLSATSLIDRSEKAETGGVSSKMGEVTFLSNLFLENIPRSPLLESGRSILPGFKGIRFSFATAPFRCIGDGRERRPRLKVDWGGLNR